MFGISEFGTVGFGTVLPTVPGVVGEVGTVEFGSIEFGTYLPMSLGTTLSTAFAAPERYNTVFDCEEKWEVNFTRV